MNFLAHIYLSGDPGPLMIGNFIGDYVKGNQLERFSPEIQKGIRLHRMIDDFTDHHAIVKKSTARFKPCYQRYASVVIDVVYDHYLAKNWEHYSSVPLSTFVNQVHAYFIRHYFTFPNRVKGFLPFLVKSRRLENYKHIWGVETSLAIMSNHTSLPAKSACATKIMLEQYEALNAEFAAFFEEVQQMVKDHL